VRAPAPPHDGSRSPVPASRDAAPGESPAREGALGPWLCEAHPTGGPAGRQANVAGRRRPGCDQRVRGATDDPVCRTLPLRTVVRRARRGAGQELLAPARRAAIARQDPAHTAAQWPGIPVETGQPCLAHGRRRYQLCLRKPGGDGASRCGASSCVSTPRGAGPGSSPRVLALIPHMSDGSPGRRGPMPPRRRARGSPGPRPRRPAVRPPPPAPCVLVDAPPAPGASVGERGRPAGPGKAEAPCQGHDALVRRG